MKLKLSLFALVFSLLCGPLVSAQDISISKEDWNSLKSDLLLLKNNNKKQQETLGKQKEELQTLKKQLEESKTALTKAEESNNLLKQSLTESKRLLTKSKQKTFSVGLTYFDDEVKPAIGINYHDVEVVGNKDFVGVFYKII